MALTNIPMGVEFIWNNCTSIKKNTVIKNKNKKNLVIFHRVHLVFAVTIICAYDDNASCGDLRSFSCKGFNGPFVPLTPLPSPVCNNPKNRLN